MTRTYLTICLSLGFGLFSQFLYGQKITNTKELASAYEEITKLEAEHSELENSGKSFKADAVQKKIDKLKTQMLKPGTIYVISPDCPAFRGTEGYGEEKKVSDDIRFYCLGEKTFDYFSAKKVADLYAMAAKQPQYAALAGMSLKYEPKLVKKYKTANNVVMKLEEIEGAFVGKIQIGGIHKGFDTILIKLLDVKKLEGKEAEKFNKSEEETEK